jgi:hypothetical protein
MYAVLKFRLNDGLMDGLVLDANSTTSCELGDLILRVSSEFLQHLQCVGTHFLSNLIRWPGRKTTAQNITYGQTVAFATTIEHMHRIVQTW